MFESLSDISNLPEMYAIYCSLFFVIIHLVWIWHVEIQFISSNQNLDKKTFFTVNHYRTSACAPLNHPIIWITKYIRKKLSSSDDEDGYVTLQPYMN